MKGDLNELLELIEKDCTIYTMFKQCPYEILRKVRVRHYGQGRFRLSQGGISDTFYIIIKGTVGIYVESEHGKRYTITTYEKGDYIGELEIFRRAPYVSGVEAKGAVSVLEIDRDVFLEWIHMDRNFNEYMMQTMCDTSYNMCRNMAENILYPLKQRVCQYVIENGDKNKNSGILMHTETLGVQMAVTPRSVSRVIKLLKEKGIISIKKGRIFIEDREALIREKDIK